LFFPIRRPKATWKVDGQERTEERKVEVLAGQTTIVDFTLKKVPVSLDAGPERDLPP
jgi:hypothetical protein